MVEIIWTLQSVEDIESIAEYIGRDSEKYAQIQVQEFFDAVETLKAFPKSGRIVPEIGNKNIRELIIGFYRIIYHIKSGGIEILTVHHSYRLLRRKTIRRRK